MTRTNDLLELVPFDICGLLNTLSLGKNKYFIAFVDDFSRKIWVYMLRQKSNAIKAFKAFKLVVKR